MKPIGYIDHFIRGTFSGLNTGEIKADIVQLLVNEDIFILKKMKKISHLLENRVKIYFQQKPLWFHVISQ